MDFVHWIVHFPSLNFGFATWRWFHNLEMIPQLGDDLQLHSRLGGDFATWFAAVKMEAWAAKWHLCAKGGFHSSFRSCEMGFGLWNFRTTWCSCLQMAITSSFQLQFVHRLKCWTPDFLSLKMRYSMHEMDPRKYSKCVQQLLSSWILDVRFLSFSSLHSWLALAKNYEAPKLEFFI